MRTLAAVLLAVALPCQAQIFGSDSVGFPAGTLPFGQLSWTNPQPAGGYIAISAPFNIAGCYASPTTQGNATITLTRATAQTRANGSVECSSGQFVVDAGGASIWKVSTQLYPTPSAPTAGTVTHTATGSHTFSVIGTGSQTLTAAGTLVATGLPCTATESAPCTYTVSSLGATPTATLSAVTGSLTFGQVEAGLYRTPQILTVAARNANIATTPAPKLGANWCIQVDATPGYNRAWYASGVINQLWGLGPNSGPNAASLMVSGGSMLFSVYDSASAIRGRTWTVNLAAGTTHTIHACMDSTYTPRLYVDRSEVGTLSVAGAGGWSSDPTTFYVGHAATSIRQWDGWLSNLKFCRSPNIGGCIRSISTVYTVALGDSLTEGYAPLKSSYPLVLRQNIGAGYVMDNRGVGGYTTTNVLTLWTGTVRALGFKRVVLMAGLNDVFTAGTTAAAAWTNLKQIIDEAVSDGAVVSLGTVTPAEGSSNYSAPKEAQRQLLNASIRAYCNGTTIRCWDADVALRDPGQETRLLPAYDSGDFAHPNQAGANVLAATAAATFP